MTIDNKNKVFSPVWLLLLALLALFLFLNAYGKQYLDSDIFWALKAGELINSGAGVPQTDPFSYTFGGSKWIDFTWGFQVIAHFFHSSLGGFTGLFILQLLVLSTTFFFLYRTLRLLSPKRMWLVWAIIFSVFAASHLRFVIRPHIFAYLFIILYFYILTLAEVRGRPRYLYLLLPLGLFWVNIHSSFILGFFIVGAYASGALIDLLRPSSKPAPRNSVIALIIATVLLPLVSIINPYGIELVIFPLVHMGGENSDALRYIGEWMPINLVKYLLNLYPLPFHNFVIKGFFFALAAALISNWRSIRTRDLILTAAVLYMAAQHARWMIIFVFFAAPIIAGNFSRSATPESGDSGSRVWPGALAALVTLIVCVMTIHYYSFVKERRAYGVGPIDGFFPEGTVAFMKANKLQGNIYNEYIYGGYLIYSYPEMKVMIDGRTPTVYSSYFFWTTRMYDREASWARLTTDLGLTSALIQIEDRFCNKLWENPEWTPVSFDDVSVLYLKDLPLNREIIEKWGFRELMPCRSDSEYVPPTGDEALLTMREELRSIPDYGVPVARRHRLLGLIDMELGGEYLKEGEAELKKAALITKNPTVHYALGLSQVELESYDKAIKTFESIIKRERGFSDAYYGLGVAYYRMKNYEEASDYLEKYIEMSADRSKDLSYKIAGKSMFNAGRYDMAARYLKRAAFLAEGKAELADIYYFIGNALLEEGRGRDSLLYYRKAIETEPEYKIVLNDLAGSMRKQGRDEAADILQALLSDK